MKLRHRWMFLRIAYLRWRLGHKTIARELFKTAMGK